MKVAIYSWILTGSSNPLWCNINRKEGSMPSFLVLNA